MANRVQQHSVNQIKIWLKAFIPKNVPNVTETFRSGPYAGKTYLEHPILDLGYLTDQRGFSNNIRASARMTCIATLSLGGSVPTLTQRSYSDRTHEVDLDNNASTCNKIASGWMDPGWFQGRPYSLMVANADLAFLTLKAAAANPCSPTSSVVGNIDFAGTLFVNLRTMHIRFSGKIDAFPAYEMYAQADNRKIVTLFQRGPQSGKGPGSLVGGPNRGLQASGTLMQPPIGFPTKDKAPRPGAGMRRFR